MSAPFASPVTTYIICGLFGLIAICEIPITGRLSVLVLQLLPPSSLFHIPPDGDPTQITFVSIGSNAIQLILPFPLFLPFERIIGVLIGPLAIQLEELLDLQ